MVLKSKLGLLAPSLALFLLSVTAQDDTCSESNPCTIGCCSKDGGYCGLGPDFCAADVCNAAGSLNGTCAQLAECDPGVYPGWGTLWGSDYVSSTNCPLNVCCSQYGFCGTTEEFCGTTTVPQPSCSGSSSSGRTVGYYEGWSLTRSCQTMSPEEIPIYGYTHLNYAFMSINPNTFAVVVEDESETPLISRFAALKGRKPDLELWISIGGWSFNDPGATATTFSDLVGSTSAQSAFFTSLLNVLETYDFDGVDIDWEYPGTSDRSGIPADVVNYVTFLSNMRSALNTNGKRYGISITLPSSYWYMQEFELAQIEPSVDWFNVMTYDLHGTWDATDIWIGNIMLAHTNLTEIKQTMDLMWRNDINPTKVTLGIGFYGRSFTMSDSSCSEAGCPFSAGGNPGRCTDSEGTLSYDEIEDILHDPTRGSNMYLDPDAAVKIVTYDGNQWVSFDDSETLALKREFADSHCIGGTMVWAVSLDTTGAAIAALTNGTNDGSDGGLGVVYVPPSIWDDSNPQVGCDAPCTLVLPPSPLPEPQTITWTVTTDLLTSVDGSTQTVPTTFTLDPFTISSVPFWPVTIASDPSNSISYTATQSVMPPSTVLTLPGSVTALPPRSGTYDAWGGATYTATVSAPSAVQTGIISSCTQYYEAVDGDSCYSISQKFSISQDDFLDWNPSVGTDCSGLWIGYYYCVATQSNYTAPVYYLTTPKFDSTSHTVVIQPPATSSIDIPIPPPIVILPPPVVDIPTCTVGCGVITCALFGCGGGCGEFGCDGGCGIDFCGGGCGPEGCGPGCGEGDCEVDGGGGGVYPPPPSGTPDPDITSINPVFPLTLSACPPVDWNPDQTTTTTTTTTTEAPQTTTFTTTTTTTQDQTTTTTTVNPYASSCPGVDISSLSCYPDCCNPIPCSDWCIDVCGGANVAQC